MLIEGFEGSRRLLCTAALALSGLPIGCGGRTTDSVWTDEGVAQGATSGRSRTTDGPRTSDGGQVGSTGGVGAASTVLEGGGVGGRFGDREIGGSDGSQDTGGSAAFDNTDSASGGTAGAGVAAANGGADTVAHVGGRDGEGSTGASWGSGGAPEVVPWPTLEEGMVFEFEAGPVQEGQYSACHSSCGPLTLVVEAASEDRLELTWGTVGEASWTGAQRATDGWRLDDKIPFAKEDGVVDSGMSYLEGGRLDPVVGEDGRLRLSLQGVVVTFWPDVGQGTSAPQTVIGQEGTRTPTAYLPTEPHRITSEFWFPVDQPLVSTATARLVPAQGDPVELTPSGMGGLVVSFSTPRVLPPGMTYQVEITGEDFVGRGTPPGGAVTTIPDFGILDDGTFSAASTEGLWGGEVIDFRTSEAGPWEKVFRADPGELVLIRLSPQVGATELAFDFRWFTPCEEFGWDTQTSRFDVFVVGQALDLIESYLFESDSDLVDVDLFDFRVRQESSKAVIPLGVTPADDVVLQFQGSTNTKFGCGIAGLLLDNIRLQ